MKTDRYLSPTMLLATVLAAGITCAAPASQPVPPAFLPGVTFDLGGPDTRTLVTGDFDGDGHADLAATLFRDTEDDGLALLFGNGAGGFPQQTAFIAGFRAFGLAAGDLDGDGRPDLVSTEGTQVKPFPRAPCGVPISAPVFLNTPSAPGTFVWKTCLDPGVFPIASVIGDFNGDGFPDVGVVDNISDDVTIFLGRGDGTFYGGIGTGPQFSNPTSAAAGDFNGDGIPDLAVGHLDAFVGRGITVMLGNGDGTFRVKQAVFSGSSVQAIRCCDLNGDGSPDLVGADRGGGKIWVCLGRGDGTFSDGVPFPAGTFPNDLALADLNGDGTLDAVTANSGSDDVTVLLGNGDGTFFPGGSAGAGHEPMAIVVADFNGDGLPDIAVSARNAGEQGTAEVLLQKPRATMLPGDCNGDGMVSIGEVQRAVDMFLGIQPSSCGVDCSADGQLSVGELQKAIDAFLGLPAGC